MSIVCFTVPGEPVASLTVQKMYGPLAGLTVSAARLEDGGSP
jgi:hypothetical protein